MFYKKQRPLFALPGKSGYFYLCIYLFLENLKILERYILKGEISNRHPAVNDYAFCCKAGQYVGIDFLLEPVATEGTAVLHFFVQNRGLCLLRRKAEMLKK